MNASLRPVDVCITIDAEFDINDSLVQPDTRTPIGLPSMQRAHDGSSQGLGFILDTLGSHSLPATFFVEVFCAYFFGIDEVRQMVAEIRAAGPHAVELHAHPCWRYFRDPDWRNSVKTLRKNDSWAGRGSEARPMMQEAIALFSEIVGQAPLAFRSGNLQVDADVHAALTDCGVPLSSSVGLGLSVPEVAELRRWIAPTRLRGALEVPVTAYLEPSLRGPRNKCLTITGTTWPVMRRMLDWAYQTQNGPLVILTHASEFSSGTAQQNDPQAISYRANPTNQARLQRLVQFLHDERARFNTVSFSDAAPAWLAAAERNDAQFVAPHLASLARAAENGWMRLRS